ncbi:metal-sensitive transcriptional regulator [Meiothermus sp.]|uniref:metal-sensitive transcriptional regulator n=2 Tax=Meiothermus sp. TaxID=1955249 RepID=UPI0039A24611|nr:metal-sensitive transcriptional regulator [Meiothermus sp.]
MMHPHPLHLDPKVQQEARNRLLSAKGHLEAILKMLEGEPYCVDVLKQIKAVQGALDKVGDMVLKSHLEHHVASAALRGDAKQMVEELMEVLKYR